MSTVLKAGIRLAVGFGLAILLALAAVGAVSVCHACRKRWGAAGRAHGATSRAAIPVSILPGPARTLRAAGFVLSTTNAQAMLGMDDAANERWCDVAGNYYSAHFVASHSYERRCARNPQVLVRIEPQADTLRGRLEVRRLKPNFAYQIKLRGVFADRRDFEAIGRIGRWRLPGRYTNYSDEDYLDCPDRAAAEAYVLFDYFVTDVNGDAVRDFALDSSLHVLWNASRQGGEPRADDLWPAVVLAGDPAVYSRPKARPTTEWLWAERESIRYTNGDQRIRLPPGEYHAELALTEESFHSLDRDGGYWATVYRCPVTFAIRPDG